MSEYNPREYWASRLEKEGPLYVTTKRSRKIYDHQWTVFSQNLQQLAPEHVGNILDFGCGVGRFSDIFQEKRYSYTGVDINEGALALAPAGVDKTFTYLASDVIPYPDAHFDGVMAITVLQHVVDSELFSTWTKELRRVVKENGFFLIIDDAETRKKLAPHMNVRGPETIASALGARIDMDLGTISAEKPNSHYCFRAVKDENSNNSSI